MPTTEKCMVQLGENYGYLAGTNLEKIGPAINQNTHTGRHAYCFRNMASIQLLQIPPFNCSSLGPRRSTFSSLGSRQWSIGLTSPLQIQRRNFLFCAGAEKDNGRNFSPPEDISYIWKLASGCIAGAIIIKYGSIFLPGITRPNLVQALFMIGVPVLTSILLLLRASGMQKPRS